MPRSNPPLFAGRAALLAATTLLLWALHRSSAAAEPSWSCDFNGPDLRWQPEEDCRFGRIETHECAAGGARDHNGIERLVMTAPGGQALRLCCPIEPMAVIDELQLRIWVKADRPDIQLAARVVLPRSSKTDSGNQQTIIVRGQRYDRPGQWQQLVLTGVPKLVEAEARLLRSTPGTSIDTREDYVVAVILIVPGDPNGVEVLTDDLVVDGIPIVASSEIELTNYPSTAASGITSAQPPRQLPVKLRQLPGIKNPPVTQDGTVRLSGDLLLVDERPFFPRAISWNEEPLQTLASIGFNAVLVEGAPTAEQSAEAKRHGLWFIGRPPKPETLAEIPLGAPGDRVIAWYLEDEALENDPNYARRWIALIRERDAVPGRPTVLAPHACWNIASKTADLVLAHRAQNSVASAENYDRWLQSRARLMRPGTPIWSGLATQLTPNAAQQIAALAGSTDSPTSVDGALLQAQVHAACLRGMRAFVFDSESPLSENDNPTRLRTAILELTNRRLQCLEPWLASGHVVGQFPSVELAWTSIVMQVEHARVLIPIESGETDETANPEVRSAASRDVTFVVPGVPESCRIYAVSPVAMKTLPVQRIAGGTRFTLRPDRDTFVLMTEDPKVVQNFRAYVARYGARTTRVLRDYAALRGANIVHAVQRLATTGINGATLAQLAAQANASIQQADTALASRYLEQAYEAASAASQTLDQAEAEARRLAVEPTGLSSNPLTLDSTKLAESASFQQTDNSFVRGDNLLYGGSFEDLNDVTQIGWRNFRGSNPGVEAAAELSTSDPRHGNYCLVLTSTVDGASPAELAMPPIWIESPPVVLSAGQLVEIIGWVRIDSPIEASDEGLQIADSLGGPELAVNIQKTNNWERFTLIRKAVDPTELRLTFALTGLGEARIDAVMVRPLTSPSPRRLPLLVPANGNAAKEPGTARRLPFVTRESRQ